MIRGSQNILVARIIIYSLIWFESEQVVEFYCIHSKQIVKKFKKLLSKMPKTKAYKEW